METVLSNDTKRIIDDARDTLVGHIPVPMMQCQQITLALTYKFMSDDDQQAVDLGGRRHYFTGDLEQYEWSKVVSLRLDDTQRSELYRNGLAALQESESLPAVFREIFKDAVVPYGDHRIMALFLQTMDRMEYDDSEKLGDAYEYLLKIAESQADAGQFRTPRHIIDFIVNIINPQKHEVIIDPACGTAGFLISAYQHVKNQHRLPGGGSGLSTPDLTRLTDNLKGYDISPEMTKLAMANMYLHTQDKNPNIDNYDTLTSTDHWNDYADVILANPPFMTPKGGIKPHGLFRVPAKRAEVLFVDYIASHLNEYGRAGIIVPEGIIFQSQNAYKQLRRLLLEECLVAVISLPAGVFKPYSGVKTSILVLDKVLAPQVEHVAFFKVENDGYDLGDQRRPIDKDDLPTVYEEISEYLGRLRSGETTDDFEPLTGLLVAKDWVSDGGDYYLTGDRYRESIPTSTRWPLVRLKDCCSAILSGGTPTTSREDHWKGDIPWITSADILDIKTALPRRFITPEAVKDSATNLIKEGNLIVVTRVGLGKIFQNNFDVCISQDSQGLIIKEGIDVSYLAWVLRDMVQDFKRTSQGSTIQGVTKKQLSEIEIPLPPLEVQRDLVAEIEGYQRVLDGARAVVDNWHPRIAIDPEWPVVELASVVKPQYGYTASASDEGEARFVRITDISEDGTLRPEGAKFITLDDDSRKHLLCKGDVLVARTGATYGKTMLFQEEHPAVFASYLIRLRFPEDIICPSYYWAFAQGDHYWSQAQALATGGGQPQFNGNAIRKIKLPVPPIETQREIAAEIEAEQALVSVNAELVERMEKRIQNTIARVWEG